MTNALSGVSRLVKRLALPPAMLVASALLWACAGPAPRDYVLGAAPTSDSASAVQTSLPVVQVERVVLPDYLDTRDIFVRRDRQVVASETGRWAERLSLGATRLIATSLAAQLKTVVVTAQPSIDPPVLRVLVDVVAFDASADGTVVLVARWTITDGPGQRSLAAEQATLRERVSGSGDGAVVGAMSLALEGLAQRVCADIAPSLDQRRRSQLASLARRPL